MKMIAIIANTTVETKDCDNDVDKEDISCMAI
jgi:hypothetical protein